MDGIANMGFPMDGLVVIWSVACLALGIGLLILWRDCRSSQDAWEDLARRWREIEQRKDVEDK